MPWVAEATQPQAWPDHAISPLVLDGSDYIAYVAGRTIAKFYKYNIFTNTWTALTDPPADLYGDLSMSPDETKVCGHQINGTRLYIYNISSPGWTTSSVCPTIPGTTGPNILNTTWAENNVIWACVRGYTGTVYRVKFMKYTVSTDTWEQFTNYVTATSHNSFSSCIRTDLSILYASAVGASGQDILKYTIATDTYGSGPTIPAGYYFVKTSARHIIFYGPRIIGPPDRQTITRTFDPDTESIGGGCFADNPSGDRTTLNAGVYGTAALPQLCLANHKTSDPVFWSYATPTSPSVTTDPASSIGKEEATLNGTLDDDGGDTCYCGFEWGETVAYGNTTPTQAKTTGQTFAQTISGLDPGKTYHFRAFATNAAGTSYGSDRTFATRGLTVGGLNPAFERVMRG